MAAKIKQVARQLQRRWTGRRLQVPHKEHTSSDHTAEEGRLSRTLSEQSLPPACGSAAGAETRPSGDSYETSTTLGLGRLRDKCGVLYSPFCSAMSPRRCS